MAELTELELNLLEVILEVLELLVGDGVVNVLSRHFGGYVLRLNKMRGKKECLMQKEDLLRRGSSLPLYKVELASYRYPNDVNWVKARKFSLVDGGTEYVEGRQQTNKSMQAELVYVREKIDVDSVNRSLLHGNFA